MESLGAPIKQRRGLIGIAFTALLVVSGACAGIPFLHSTPGPATNPQVQEISRCGVIPTAFCLVSFGAADTNQMLISFLVPPTSSSDYYLKVQRDETATEYPCQVAKDFPSSIYCTGEQIPLGTLITIELHSTRGNGLLARGTFVINALAIPTPIIVVVTIETTGTFTPYTPLSTQGITPSAATGTPLPTRASTPSATPINPYANPYRNP